MIVRHMKNAFSFKIILLGLTGWFLAQKTTAQTTMLPRATYDSLLTQAKRNGKPIVLFVKKSESTVSHNLQLSQRTKRMLEEQFVSGTVELDRDDFNHPLHKTYTFPTSAYLFTDSAGFPLLRYNQPIQEEETLVRLIDSANRIAKGETMGKLMQQYKKGIHSQSLLRNLLEQYPAFDAYTDQQVLNDYLSQLTVQELNNFETVVFLLRCGPVYNSKTYQLARINNTMVDSLYTTLPLPTRREINRRIIRQTFREALDKHDYSMALNLGYFLRRTWHRHYLRSQMAQTYYPMEYQRLHRDTTAYLQTARDYYNRFYAQVEPDSLAKWDFAIQRRIDTLQPRLTFDPAHQLAFQQWLKKRQKRYLTQHAYALSFGARQLLDFGKNNPDALFDAIRWQQQAIVLDPGKGQFHHTLAQLLYHVGFYAEAEAQQRQAMRLYKSDKPRYLEMRDALKQLQAHSW